VAREYAYVMPDRIVGGVVSMEFVNAGDELHEFALGRLAPGVTPEQARQELTDGDGDPGPELVEDIGGVPFLTPGKRVTVTRKLSEGTYVLLCFIPAPDGRPHIEHGMIRSFKIEGDSGKDLPKPDAVIIARTARFDVPVLHAGRQTIELRNAAREDRGFVLMGLKPGKTPHQNVRFLVFLAAILKGVHKHAGLLRAGIGHRHHAVGQVEVAHQLDEQNRRADGAGDTPRKAWADHGVVMVVADRDHATRLSDEVAAEHLEVHTSDDAWYLERLRNYGSIFLGSRATVAFSDKAIGTNHTLPTGHAARYTGGLSVAKFLKTLTYQRIDSDEGVRAVAPHVVRDLPRRPDARPRGDRHQAPRAASEPVVEALVAPFSVRSVRPRVVLPGAAVRLRIRRARTTPG